jgi:hypothetical protein
MHVEKSFRYGKQSRMGRGGPLKGTHRENHRDEGMEYGNRASKEISVWLRYERRL